ncbi:hypothetical protein [Mesorhizobium sp. SP-1A]|uniref:hypothetical protein n=1 Tax=Mesorhizobium sp. SP-1A TaxID=3077840 RepID=UPI0028F739C9|nr:hypothetical protein [Mesorhizobium sp. SP-1A]
MKKLLMAGALVSAFALPASEAGAVGYISGAVAGGVAGHYAGHHGVLGAMGGCIAGHELHKKQMAARKLKHQQQVQHQPAATPQPQAQ